LSVIALVSSEAEEELECSVLSIVETVLSSDSILALDDSDDDEDDDEEDDDKINGVDMFFFPTNK